MLHEILQGIVLAILAKAGFFSRAVFGAHAQVRAEALLTRDSGYYRRYFRNLRIVSP